MFDLDPLFAPLRIKDLNLRNRLVMAPMTRRMSPGQVPSAEVAAYYKRRALGGVGLIITEGTTCASPAASGDPDVPAFFGPALDGWAEVVKQVTAAGAHIMPQLWHQGMMRNQETAPDPHVRSVSPSECRSGALTIPSMTEAEISEAIEAFAQSAGHAKDLGFSGVEIQGGHGYLLDQFLWTETNRRTDKFGGDLIRRARFASEVVRAVRREVGPSFVVQMRFSQWKAHDYNARIAHSPDELETILLPLVDAGVDSFHCSTRRFWEPEFDGSELNLAGWTKKLTGLPTISVGSVGLNRDASTAPDQPQAFDESSLRKLLVMMERADFDLVAIGRTLIANPDLPRLLWEGRLNDIRPYSRNALSHLN